MAATSPESVKTFDPFYPKSVESIEPSDLASERVEHSKKSEGTEVLVSDLGHPPAAEHPKEFHDAGSCGFKYSSNEDPRIQEVPDEYFYGSHDITDEELAFHLKQVEESDGFDIINIPNCDKNVVDAASAIKTFQAKLIDDTSGYISGSGKREMIVKICRLKPTEEQGD